MEQIESAYSLAREPGDIVGKAYTILRDRLGAAASEWDTRTQLLIREDLAYHTRFISSAAAMNDDVMLRDYLLWVDVLCTTLGFKRSSMARAMNSIGVAIATDRRDDRGDDNLADWFFNAEKHFVAAPPERNPYLETSVEGDSSAALFLRALLEGKREYARSIVHTHETEGQGLLQLYDKIFVPSQRELGRLWHLGQISVAQEHFVTAATQGILSSLYDKFFLDGSKNADGGNASGGVENRGKPRMIAACAQGELHELGIRMIADSFQAEGWDTIFLGANLPESDLVKEVERVRPDFVSLSATIPTHIPWMKRAISELRKQPSVPKILVGGRLFAISGDLWRKVGADAMAVDCGQALAVARNLRATA